MQSIVLDAEAGQVSSELLRRGLAPDTLVHVLINVAETPDLPVAALAHAGGAFGWLAEEPDLYCDEDLIRPS